MSSNHTKGMTGLKGLDNLDVNKTPVQVAEDAHYKGDLLNPRLRTEALESLTRDTSLGSTATGKALQRILDNADRGARILSTIGYMPLRHLRAIGLTLSQIADDLEINLHDLTEFMAQSPTAVQDAEIDAEAYADRKASELLEKLSSSDRLSKDAVELLKVRQAFLLEYNKRLSHKWAQRESAETQRMPNLVINIGQNNKPVAAPRVKQVEDSVVAEQDGTPDNSDQFDHDDAPPSAGVHWLVEPKTYDPTQDEPRTNVHEHD